MFTALILSFISAVSQRVMALLITTLMSLWISATIIARIQRIIKVVKQSLIVFWLNTLVSLWISAVIIALI